MASPSPTRITGAGRKDRSRGGAQSRPTPVNETEACALANATSLATSATNGNEPAGQHFVSPATVALHGRVFKAGEFAMPLKLGMSVTAEIKTDQGAVEQPRVLANPADRVGDPS